jgi:cytochrome c-type biogenesis protein CcmH
MPGEKGNAGSMDSAIAALEARLAKGGGSADDWELLAKSFEFLGRPADAAKARARQLPALAEGATAGTDTGASGDATAGTPPAVAAGLAVTGEVTLAKDLNGKARVGETLFIVAKSVASPGIPVAVFRGSVGSWPLKFTLDDSQSMMPGRNLSSAGRVTIEARISQKGQPLPAAGDLQGSSGIIDPADHRPLKILIDRVIT